MLLIQIPGTWIWFFDMVLFENERWPIWLSTFVAALQMTLLLVQVLYYDLYLRRKNRSLSLQNLQN